MRTSSADSEVAAPFRIRHSGRPVLGPAGSRSKRYLKGARGVNEIVLAVCYNSI